LPNSPKSAIDLGGNAMEGSFRKDRFITGRR
jgi:hypothetical protein